MPLCPQPRLPAVAGPGGRAAWEPPGAGHPAGLAAGEAPARRAQPQQPPARGQDPPALAGRESATPRPSPPATGLATSCGHSGRSQRCLGALGMPGPGGQGAPSPALPSPAGLEEGSAWGQQVALPASQHARVPALPLLSPPSAPLRTFWTECPTQAQEAAGDGQSQAHGRAPQGLGPVSRAGRRGGRGCDGRSGGRPGPGSSERPLPPDRPPTRCTACSGRRSSR